MEKKIYKIKNIFLQEKFNYDILNNNNNNDDNNMVMFRFVVPFSINNDNNNDFKNEKIYKNIAHFQENNNDDDASFYHNLLNDCYVEKIQILINKHTYPFDIGLNIPGDPFPKYSHFAMKCEMFSFISSHYQIGQKITLHEKNYKEDENFQLWGGIHPKNMEQNIVNIPQLDKLKNENNVFLNGKYDDDDNEEFLLPFWHIIIQYLKITQDEIFLNQFVCLFDNKKRNVPVLYKIPRIILFQTKDELKKIYNDFNPINLIFSKIQFTLLENKKNNYENNNNNDEKNFCLNGFIFYDIIPLEYKENIYNKF